MTTKLFKTLQESATQHTWTLVARTEFHWQILREGTATQQPVLLANIWPTRMKFQRCWPMLHAVRVLQVEGMLDLMKKIFQEFNTPTIDTPTITVELRLPDRTDKQQTRQQSLPFVGPIEVVGKIKRTANIDLVMDGTEMRVLISTNIHAESYRLDACQTLTLLDKAVLLRQQLLNTPLTETENHVACPADVDRDCGEVENGSKATLGDLQVDPGTASLVGQVDCPPG